MYLILRIDGINEDERTNKSLSFFSLNVCQTTKNAGGYYCRDYGSKLNIKDVEGYQKDMAILRVLFLL